MTDDSVLNELLEKVGQRADTYAYFFEKLDTPTWIGPLRDRGFFKDPIGVEHLEGGYVRFPVWPESRALARLAEQDEDTVMDIILACPETDNPRVHDDFADAALRMSPQKAALLIPKVAEWLRKPFKLLLPQKAGKLLARLSEARLDTEALALAKHLFALVRVDVAAGLEPDIAIPPRFHALFDDWDYKTILEEDVPPFVRAVGLPALDVLCTALHDALRAEGERFGGQPNDASYIWRPSIAEHDQNLDYEPKEFLVTAIREAAHILITSQRTAASDVIDLLERQGWQVFDRLAMQVATTHADREPVAPVRLLLRRDLFDSYEVSNEYSALIPVALRLAGDADRTTWLSWIADGPDSAGHIERVRSRGEPEPTAKELTYRADAWRWQRIAFAPDEALDKNSRRMRDDLAKRFEEPSPLPFAIYTSVGTVSPLADDEAAAMSMSELAAYASSVPATQHRFDSPEEGLASVLAAQARARPAEASKGLGHFKSLKPLYMRSLFSGLEEAVQAASPDISWPDVLAIAQWVLEQPREVEGGSGGAYSDLDPGWVWTVSAIAGLLEEGLRRRLLAAELQDDIWRVLTALLAEPEQEADTDDPGTDSLNRVRGKAMHGIVLYADWLFEIKRSNGRPPPRAFAENSPEVVDVLDAALDPEVQTSAAVRAVFGMRAAYFMKLDPEWMASRAPRIFSVDERGRFDRLGRAAWSSYLKYSRAFLDLVALLRPQYEQAVAAIPEEAGDAGIKLQEHLAEHLMRMYWHGQLGPAPFEDPLLAAFWSAAGATVRKRALAFVGRSLREAKDGVAEDVKDRLMRLWDEYVRRSRETHATDVSELRAFGRWVNSGVFEFAWAVSRAIEVLEISRGIDSQGEVISVLAEAPAPDLGLAVKALRLIVANDREGWAVFGHQEDARALLKAALRSQDPDAVEEAKTAVDLLIARGFSDFRGLLDGDQSP